MEKRYPALRVIGTIYKILGVIIGVLTILAIFIIFVASIIGGAAAGSFGREFGGGAGLGLFSSVFGGFIISIFVLIYGGVLSISLYAMGEGVYLLLALEENTRTTTMLLRQQIGLGPSQPSGQ